MAPPAISLVATVLATSSLVAGHASIWHNSAFGFNESTAPNRLLDPLMAMSFDEWWFHGFLDKPPNDGDFMELPAGGTVHSEIACDKGYTSWYESAAGGDIRSADQPDYPCPGQPLSEFHTTGIDDLGGCALAIAYESDATAVKPEDFAVFSVNQTCVWTLHTDFQVPAAMPACPEGGCTCAWFWIHTPDSGAEQMYMTGFKCQVTGATSTTPIATPQLARRCGADPSLGRAEATPSNCTYGAKQPFYWYQAEGNTFFEDTYHPPLYTDLYNFLDGAQDDIFVGAATTTGSFSTASASATDSYSASASATDSASDSGSDSGSGSYTSTDDSYTSTADSYTSTADSYTPPADTSTYVAPTSTYTPPADTDTYTSTYVAPASSSPTSAPSSPAAPIADPSPAPAPASSSPAAVAPTSDPVPSSPAAAPTSDTPTYTPPSRPSSGVSKRWNPSAQPTSPALARYMHSRNQRARARLSGREMEDGWGSWGRRRGFGGGEDEEEV